MNINVKGPLGGEVRIPASKSQAHRLLICAALTDRECRIECQALNDDICRTVECLRALGAGIRYESGAFYIKPIPQADTLTAGASPKPCFRPCKGSVLDCGESGSTLRFLLPVAAVLETDATFTGRGRLPQRPLSPLYEEMTAHGVHMSEYGHMPLSCHGRLVGGRYELAANVSSQFISGLLFALPLTGEECSIRLTGKLESGSYIEMTLQALDKFGIKVKRLGDTLTLPPAQRYRIPEGLETMSVEGDWSSAAFWLVAGAVGQTPISCLGLNATTSRQGDRAIVDILKRMGACIEVSADTGKECITSRPAQLKGCRIDCRDTPDLVPALAVAAAMAEGDTVFDNIARLRLKESDRVAAVCDMLQRFGIEAHTTADTLTVKGGHPHGATVDSVGDHRIAMAAAVLGASIAGENTTITDAGCVAKSYPAFFDDFRVLGGIAEKNG